MSRAIAHSTLNWLATVLNKHFPAKRREHRWDMFFQFHENFNRITLIVGDFIRRFVLWCAFDGTEDRKPLTNLIYGKINASLFDCDNNRLSNLWRWSKRGENLPFKGIISDLELEVFETKGIINGD